MAKGDFWRDFKKGFKKGWNTTKKITGKIPILKEGSDLLPTIHGGGTVPRTPNFRLKGGETVFNKTQMARLRKAKTQKTKNKIINEVKRKRPKKPKQRKRK